MKRDRTSFLKQWLVSATRKPLVVRGARQVGKTWLIRDFAKEAQRQLIELNFEKQPDAGSLFFSNNPQEILAAIGASVGKSITPSQAILFLDEIQAAPQLLEKLRWFAEELPELPVVAAGSLLDFALEKHSFSMPVGRISYMYLEPFSFEEFLEALGQQQLRAYLQNYDWQIPIPNALHLQLLKLLKEYLIIGGMPAAVSSWANKKAPEAISQIHFDLLSTYRDDFVKYSGRLGIEKLQEVMNSVPYQLGKKFVYSDVNPNSSSTPLKQALDLLTNARVCHKIFSTHANGLPLGAEIESKFFKAIMLDCGLCSASLGLSLHQLHAITEITLINNGGMAEQLVGQILRTLPPAYIPVSLYYWHRHKKGSEAEVDYIIQHEDQLIPVEVKAGTTGTLKSLHQFMKEKQKTIAVRINSDLPKLGPVSIKDSFGASIEYTLLSLPFYLLGQLHRLIRSATN